MKQQRFHLNRYRTLWRLTDAGLEKSSPQDCVSPRGHFAPRLFLLSFSFSEINSSAKICMALKRHTVLYRLRATRIFVLEFLSKKRGADRNILVRATQSCGELFSVLYRLRHGFIARKKIAVQQ